MNEALKKIQDTVNSNYQSLEAGKFKPVKGCYYIEEVITESNPITQDVQKAKGIWKRNPNVYFVEGTQQEFYLSFLYSHQAQGPKHITPKELVGKIVEIKFTDYIDTNPVIEWAVREQKFLCIGEEDLFLVLFFKGRSWNTQTAYEHFINSQSDEIKNALSENDYISSQTEDHTENPDDEIIYPDQDSDDSSNTDYDAPDDNATN